MTLKNHNMNQSTYISQNQLNSLKHIQSTTLNHFDHHPFSTTKPHRQHIIQHGLDHQRPQADHHPQQTRTGHIPNAREHIQQQKTNTSSLTSSDNTKSSRYQLAYGHRHRPRTRTMTLSDSSCSETDLRINGMNCNRTATHIITPNSTTNNSTTSLQTSLQPTYRASSHTTSHHIHNKSQRTLRHHVYNAEPRSTVNQNKQQNLTVQPESDTATKTRDQTIVPHFYRWVDLDSFQQGEFCRPQEPNLSALHFHIHRFQLVMYTQCSLNCWFHNWIWLGEARPLSSACWMKVGFEEYWRSDECARHDHRTNPSTLSPALPHTHTSNLILLTHSVPPILNLLSLVALFTVWVHSRSITANRVWVLWGRWKGSCVKQRPLTSFPCY